MFSFGSGISERGDHEGSNQRILMDLTKYTKEDLTKHRTLCKT